MLARIILYAVAAMLIALLELCDVVGVLFRVKLGLCYTFYSHVAFLMVHLEHSFVTP